MPKSRINSESERRCSWSSKIRKKKIGQLTHSVEQNYLSTRKKLRNEIYSFITICTYIVTE